MAISFKKGKATTPQGAPNQEQLPPGGAEQLNQQTAVGEQAAAQSQAQDAQTQQQMQAAEQQAAQQQPQGPGGPQAATAPQPDSQVRFTPKTEEEQYLFSPNAGPPQHPFKGLTRSLMPAPPDDVKRARSAFEFAANLPGAPPQMQALVDLIDYHTAQVNQPAPP